MRGGGKRSAIKQKLFKKKTEQGQEMKEGTFIKEQIKNIYTKERSLCFLISIQSTSIRFSFIRKKNTHLNYPNVVWKDAINIDTRKDLTGILKDRV